MISPLRVSRRSWATNQGTAWHGPPSQILEANRLPEMSPQISQVTEMKHSGPLWALMGSAIWQDQPEQREPVPGETFFPGCSICCRTPKAGDRTPGPMASVGAVCQTALRASAFTGSGHLLGSLCLSSQSATRCVQKTAQPLHLEVTPG